MLLWIFTCTNRISYIIYFLSKGNRQINEKVWHTIILLRREKYNHQMPRDRVQPLNNKRPCFTLFISVSHNHKNIISLIWSWAEIYFIICFYKLLYLSSLLLYVIMLLGYGKLASITLWILLWLFITYEIKRVFYGST